MLESAAVVLAFMLGALVQTVAGFGSALVAMPILSLVISVRTAAPVQVLLGFLVTLTVLYQNWHALRWREAARLIAGSVVGVPLGTLALKMLPAGPVMACLGLVLLGYGLFTLWDARRRPVEDSKDTVTVAPVVSWFVGLCSGILGGAYATDGPPLIIYGAIRQWPKAAFKSILQTCFLVNGVLMVACHGAAGLITRDVFRCCLLGLPGLILGMVLGSYLDRRINHERFRRLLFGLILLLGIMLLVHASLSF
jgi:uncharacterized membrane protein YfcA